MACPNPTHLKVTLQIVAAATNEVIHTMHTLRKLFYIRNERIEVKTKHLLDVMNAC
jgi:hypothetical protein